MSVFRALRGLAAAACVAISLLLVMASGAFAASSVYICVGEEAGSPVRSGGATGSCKTKETSVALPSEAAEQQKLLSILPHVKYEASGVAGKPTIQFSGVNVQVVNGQGKTATTNGEGNLVIGYDEIEKGIITQGCPPKQTQTGSHNLILGVEQTFTSFGGIDAGACSNISGEYASVTGGDGNAASGRESAVSGGYENKARGNFAWVGGGGDNTAGTALPLDNGDSVSGGRFNTAIGSGAPVEGWASVSGGKENKATGIFAWIGGGYRNGAESELATVDGGALNKAQSQFSWIGGGDENTAGGKYSSVSGGENNTAASEASSILGGEKNTANGVKSSILGGKLHEATLEFQCIPSCAP